MDGIPTKNVAPQSFLFFVIANVGPGKSHRPIAVALRNGVHDETQAIKTWEMTRYCMQTIDVLSDVGNHTAIRAELDLAAEFYKNDKVGDLLPRVRLPEFYRWSSSPELDAKRFREWDNSLPQFPFVATCLQVGIGYNPVDGSENAVWREALGTAYNDNTLEYGMVVIDISDLNVIRYGIIGFTIYTCDRMIGSADERTFPPTVEEHRPRLPLSVNDYVNKFHPQSSEDSYSFEDVENRLQKRQLIAVSAMDFIWPANLDGDTITVIQVGPQVNHDKMSPGEEAITDMVGNIFRSQSLDVPLIDELRALPDFRDTLCRQLRERFEKENLLQPKLLGQLLGIAFTSQQHLDWILIKGLPTDAIAVALEMPELKEANSIGLCIDTILGTPNQLLEALSLSSSLRELYLLQEPSRETDNASTELFLEMLSTRHLDLSRYKIVLTGPFSSALRRKFWLPTTDLKLNFRAFPIEHMFVRHVQTGPDSAVSFPNHIYLGDAMLRPERFAAGFLQYLRYLITGDSVLTPQLYSFACAPSSLVDVSHKEISPIPAESFAIPVQTLKRDIERKLAAGLPAELGGDAMLPECWPKVRDLVSGSWVVLVSKEQYRDVEAINTRDWSVWPQKPTEASYIRYAFIRVKTQIPVEDAPEIIRPETIEVLSLNGFLQATAPEVDSELIDKRLEELELYISTAPDQVALSPELKWLSVLELHEASTILKDFLEDAAYVKENLRLAMEDDPEGRNWYPELLRVDESGSVQREHARNEEVFIV